MPVPVQGRLREIANRTGTRVEPGVEPRHVAVIAWDPAREGNDLRILARRAEIAYGAHVVLYPHTNRDPVALQSLLSTLTDPRFPASPNLPAHGGSPVNIPDAGTTSSAANEERYKYDICLSFAGEQRAYVEQVATILRQQGVQVFYDDYEKTSLWGRDLYEHLDWIYRKAARYCVLFASADYARKIWTTHERQSAQARALREHEVYVLPVRFDDTEIPELRPTVAYVDLRTTTPSELAELIIDRLNQ